MPLWLLLTLLAAVAHAAWNLLLKGAQNRLILLWWSLLGGFLAFGALLLRDWPLDGTVLPYVLGSVLMEVLYFIALAFAYQQGDFSLIYPMARGFNPVLLSLLAFLFLHEIPSRFGVGGLFLVLLGLGLLGGSRGGRISFRGLMAAVCVALTSSTCSVIDAAAVRLVPSLPYSILVMGLTVVATTPLLFWRYDRALILATLRQNLGRALAVGFLLNLAFLLTTRAFSLSKAGYVGAVREVSVVLGALAGWLWLNEGFGLQRVLGAALIFGGILAIALAG